MSFPVCSAEMLPPPPSLLSPTSALAFKTLKTAFSVPSVSPVLLPFPPGRHHRRFFCLASADNNRIQSVLFPSIIDPASTHLPIVRTYESNIAILSITGSAGSDQAVAAAAADGGATAEEHLSSGAEAMVIETQFPGGTADGNSTVSTKLFLPAKKVKEKAKKLRKNTGSDTLSGSKNILPTTCRQVVMDQLWSFSLTILAPGSERNMDDLTAPREMKANFTVSSSDEMFLSHLSEAVGTIVMENTRSTYNKNSKVKNSSHDISISIHNVAEKDLVNYVMNQPEIRTLVVKGESLRSFLWEPPSYRMLERICSRELVDRMHWFLPAYRLQVIFNAFKELKLEGWHEVAENRWEVLLTHFQMMELANVLDLYYEDQYTLPGKRLLCGPLSEPVNPTRNTGSFLKVLLATITGFFIISLLGIGARVFGAHLSKPKVHSQENFNVCTSEDTSGLIYSTNIDVVVLSEQGEVVGFQPTNRVAVSNWASHPLAKELYKGRKLTPGILEPNLKIPRPEKVVLIELLTSTNPDSFFALARPIREHGELVLAKG
ncbi:deneddylase isoform X2 [Carex rostrata]